MNSRWKRERGVTMGGRWRGRGEGQVGQDALNRFGIQPLAEPHSVNYSMEQYRMKKRVEE